MKPKRLYLQVPCAALLVLAGFSGCELQIATQGSETTYSQSVLAGPGGMLLGLLLLVGGVVFFRTKLPYNIRKVGAAVAFIGVVFIGLGVSIIGTYVTVGPERLEGRTGVIWDRNSFNIRFAELDKIEFFIVEPHKSNTKGKPRTMYRFVFESGEEIEVQQEAYLKHAQPRILHFAKAKGVRIINE